MQGPPHSSGLISPLGVIWTNGKTKGEITRNILQVRISSTISWYDDLLTTNESDYFSAGFAAFP